MLVKFENTIYRLPVRPAKTQQQFEEFKRVNHNCEVLVFSLNGGHNVVPLDFLEFVAEADDRLYS